MSGRLEGKVALITGTAGGQGRAAVLLFAAEGAPKFVPIAELSDEDWPELSDEDWHFTIRNELDLIFYVVSEAWEHLVARGSGSIINTGSISGMSSLRQTPGNFAHAATKGAVIALTRELASEGGPHGIRVNSISPGMIESPATAKQLEDPRFRQDHLDAIMLSRIGRPEDIAKLALYLASDESEWVTGANFVIDGGFMAR